MTKDTDGQTIEQLDEQIETTQKLLTKLESEFADFGDKMHIAASDGDSASMLDLQLAHQRKPYEIRASRLRLEQLRLRRYETKLLPLQAEFTASIPPINKLMEQERDVKEKLIQARNTHYSVEQDLKDCRTAISEKKREIERLLHQKTAA